MVSKAVKDVQLRLRAFWKGFISIPSLADELTARRVLMFSIISLICIGTTMIGSASIPYGDYKFNAPFYFIDRQLIYLFLGVITVFFSMRVPLKFWLNQTFLLWAIVLVLLIIVLIPGIGANINGSKRWIRLIGFTFQPSELAKFVMVLFTADYVVRREDEIRFSWTGFFRLLVPMSTVLFLLLLEPDLGASVVVVASMMTVFFLAGAPLRQFGVMLAAALLALAAAIIFEPYRLRRMTSFANPWDDELGADYQLKQSLIAFGRGEITGTGLGHSVQKLSYLPEAHTDFLLAIIGEELGFVGIACLFTLLIVMVVSCMRIGHRALVNQYASAGYLAYGIATIFLLQILVNGGMNMGLLPTKGLTLPFISYGGTSLIMSLMMIGVLLRIDQETQKPKPRSARDAYLSG
ncbi:MAG: putative lipid II flippase FtsW [Candidatus Saccharibacteria bacterium]|nr:putative lipid II flippase FtsW [Moraxellaceae bacterium]